MTTEIERLNQHVIICGFGRIGVMLAKDLKDGGADKAAAEAAAPVQTQSLAEHAVAKDTIDVEAKNKS